MKRLIFFFILFLFYSNVVWASPGGGTARFEKRVVEFTLPNGMKWMLVKNGEAPVFAGAVMVKAGGVDEVRGKTGIAHLLEHMAFKGTKDISGEELWEAFLQNGANDVNAWTAKDMTTYHAAMPASKVELWLYLTSEILFNSVMKDFYKERDVVTEEYTGSVENRPYGKMNKALLAAAFKEGGYGWPVIGIKDDLIKLEASDATDFKKRLYVPTLMTGSIAGNIDIERTKELIARYFGRFHVAQTFRSANIGRSKDLRYISEKGEGMKRESVTFDASKNFMMAFHKPTLPTRDDYVFDVITYLLCYGENSRLTKKLVYEKRLIRTISCDSSVPGARFDNLFLMLAEPIGGTSYKEAEAAIDAELEGLKNEKVTTGELEKIINNISKDFYFEVATNEGITQDLASYQTLAGDWRYMTRRLETIETITPEDVMDVAKRYFVDDNKIVVELERP